MNSRWKQYLFYASLIIVGGGLLYVLIETVKAKNTGFETKTLWDWMELLIIPLVLAIGAFYLNRSERAVERQIAENRTKEDRQLAEKRAKLERKIAIDRQEENALQTYLDRMTELLLKNKLRTSRNKELRNVARIRTLTVLRGLDPKRKGLVLQFLYEAGLISKEKSIVDLRYAHLWDADLMRSNLSGANLSFADLNGADLYEASLNDTDLRHAIMPEVDLRYADLSNANLEGAGLDAANLEGTDLSNANLRSAELTDVDLTKTFFSVQTCETLTQKVLQSQANN